MILNSNFYPLRCIANDFNRQIIAENIWFEINRPLTTTLSSARDDNLSRVSHPFPKLGINLKGMREFVQRCGGREALQSLTTAEVNAKYQKLITFANKISYCDLLASEGSTYVGQAQAFASHAWKYKFLDALDALEQTFKDYPDLYIWFDNFSQNQHIAAELDFTWFHIIYK